MLKDVVDDNTTEPGLASSLTEIQEEQNQPATETCGNEADDDGDGTIDENCPPLISNPTETCGNEADDDGDGTIDEEDCVVPPAETCGNEADDDGDGTIDEEDCVVPQLKHAAMKQTMMVMELLMKKIVLFLQLKYVITNLMMTLTERLMMQMKMIVLLLFQRSNRVGGR